jgi:uncharacterized protein
MALVFNLRHLEEKSLFLQGDLSAEELDLQDVDDLIQLAGPLHYDLEVQKLNDSLLVQGSLKLALRCECARCLTPFEQRLDFDDWTRHFPLAGADAVAVVNDCVDLTPYLREDILLAFPQHPLCKTDCGGLPKQPAGRANDSTATGDAFKNPSAWAELNKLKLK